jgi:DNA modification methylase
MIVHGDCVAEMATMPEASVDAIVTDPPYGLEFMGKEWDRLGGEAWRTGGGFSKPGIGDRPTAWASYGAGDTANATCATCGGRMRGAKRCDCDEPDWRVKGKPLGESQVDSRGAQSRRMQAWHEAWAREALRVLKPGGHLLAFGGTRTYHRLACAIEDAGFEIRDCLSWMYGSGFPKSLDVGKAIDRAAGAEREVVGSKLGQPGKSLAHLESEPYERDPERGWQTQGGKRNVYDQAKALEITAPATPEAQQWQGWGTALKPSHEPIVLARKPLAGTVAGNVLEYGTGALNVDGCRIGHDEPAKTTTRTAARFKESENGGVRFSGSVSEQSSVAGADPSGRWPANVVLSHHENCEQVGTRRVKPSNGSGLASPKSGGFGGGMFGDGEADNIGGGQREETVEAWRCVESCPVRLLDEQSGELRSPALRSTNNSAGKAGMFGQAYQPKDRDEEYGGASRFFYCAKSSSAERNAGLEGFEGKQVAVPALAGPGRERVGDLDERGKQLTPPRRNHHPTVKPIALMRWLVRLVTPPGGTVLDPFTGSGTTGIAAALEGFNFVGIEREDEYVKIAQARIAWWKQHPEGMELVKGLEADRERKRVAGTGQLGLLD